MEFIQYETQGRVAVLTLDRPEARNAQTPQLLRELDANYDRATEDENIRVIVLKANGKHFSAGHDISPEATKNWKTEVDVGKSGLAGLYEWERKNYLGMTRKWRDLPKPTIAAVQGGCIAAGLMLCWPCDLIVAADDAWFTDPVARMGIGGVEYHGHTWEFGARKAKELLFTGNRIGAEEAERLGMVNRVVPRAELVEQTLALATQIAEMDPFALSQAKRAVNQTLDIQGFYTSLQSVFDMHSLGHGNALSVTKGELAILMDLEGMKKKV
ncbi:MAG: enoyl-CoA hydratase [Deltaproteobacteria bacterium]|nr:enoyl-CoA hydratase [Deltaproteobacteria bacterium]